MTPRDVLARTLFLWNYRDTALFDESPEREFAAAEYAAADELLLRLRDAGYEVKLRKGVLRPKEWGRGS